MEKVPLHQQPKDSDANSLSGELLLNPLPSHRFLFWSVLLWCLVICVIIANVSYRQKTPVMGWLEPIDGVKRTFNMTNMGVIDKVYVSNGEKVVAGQPVLQISHVHPLTENQTAESELTEQLNADNQRISEKITVLATHKKMQIQALESQRQQLKQEIMLIADAIDISARRVEHALTHVEKQHSLHNASFIAEVEKTNSELALLDSQNELVQIRRQQHMLKREEIAITLQIEMLATQHQQQLVSLEAQRHANEQQLARIRHAASSLVFAPQDGYVYNLMWHEGDAVAFQQYLFSTVNNQQPLKAYALVPSHQVGMIAEGAEARIRFDAFPYQEYGSQVATITHISDSLLLPQDHLQIPLPIAKPSYLIELSLSSQENNDRLYKKTFRPGMTFAADIATAHWKLINKLLAPFTTKEDSISWGI